MDAISLHKHKRKWAINVCYSQPLPFLWSYHGTGNRYRVGEPTAVWQFVDICLHRLFDNG